VTAEMKEEIFCAENSSPNSSINEQLAPMMSQLDFKCGSCSFSAPLNRSLKTRIETNHPTQKSEIQLKLNAKCATIDAMIAMLCLTTLNPHILRANFLYLC
jgi:hypothetical protein